ncbi:MAG TPA: hypothetical protein VHW23_05300 [Kofleriaceae bacterium]|jgi:hypothetical protein|nr:hypothetical protein [Kofleriaceae bacterium]
MTWRGTRAWLPRLAVATALATSLAGPPAWAHVFPPLHTVVVQVERCELAVLVGYAAGTGEPTERIIARAASQPKSLALDALRASLTAFALAPLQLSLDGQPLAPSAVHAKIGLDGGGTRPIVVVLATFALPRGGALAIRSTDPRTTRISWQDRSSGRVDLDRAPAQDHWYTAVASFLLPLVSTGGSACATSGSSPPPDSPAR